MSDIQYKILIVTLPIAMLFVSPAASMSVSYSAGGGDGGSSISNGYSLGDKVSLDETTVISSSGLSQSRQAEGFGNSTLSQQISGPGYTVSGGISGSGTIAASGSSLSTGQGAAVSQTISGQGSIGLGLEGTQGTVSTGQAAGVEDGAISSSQSLVAYGSATSSQSTTAKGQSSSIGTSAVSASNCLQVAGAAGKDGEISAGLISEASSAAALGGSVSLNGMSYLSNSDLSDISSNNIGMAVNSLYADSSGGVQKFDLSALNTDAGTYQDALQTTRNLDGAPAYQSYGARAGAFESYSLGGWRWTSANPQIQMYLRADANMQSMGLDASSVRNALAADAAVWDGATSQSLFASNPVIIDSTKAVDTRDGFSVVGWKNSGFASPSTLAVTRTWYQGTTQNGYYPVIEADISFNMADSWSTNGGSFDVQAAALHEMGHLVGLDDIYNKQGLSSDMSQIMNYYTGARHDIGNGDREGVHALYG